MRRKNYSKYIFLFLFFITIPLFILSLKKDKEINKLNEIIDNNYLLESEVNRVSSEIIKKYEGFSEKTYICPSGKKTIGYGSVSFLKDLEAIKLNKRDAEKLLSMNVDFIILRIKYNLFKEEFDYFYENELSAIVSLVYNIGESNFKKSRLFKEIKSYISSERNSKKLKNKIKDDWLEFHYYKDYKDNKMKRSVCKEDGLCLFNRRNEEINLFFKN